MRLSSRFSPLALMSSDKKLLALLFSILILPHESVNFFTLISFASTKKNLSLIPKKFQKNESA